MIDLISSFISTGIEALLAYGALVGAVVAFVARFEPRTPNWLSTLATTALLCVSVWFFSTLHHDRQAEVAQLKADNNALTRVATAHKIISKQASEKLLDRIQQISTLEEKVRDYELELERGKITACPSDPAYLSRMRALQFRKAR
ncbi:MULTISPECIES: hypothetical protein [unclassified Pseudovibrio]|uniref:hypothetical protein n=1 Tax=unclassified Pseudovibrio TaxID=2627060 RepID=UPI0007AE74AF|nr:MULTISPECIES: hypothetical protein [unclassified Pseudovibrio]KZK97955.1 hypothetical protein PsAD5_02194 [Pseudovibrio sp. Ad5]KZL02251.1 hypothetical protein PsW74_01349 [Pseudovibrio sp. W74]KZL08205.1 hypothetical protein PsAD14_03352 [Pseudovibrio sp. Ad14]